MDSLCLVANCGRGRAEELRRPGSRRRLDFFTTVDYCYEEIGVQLHAKPPRGSCSPCWKSSWDGLVPIFFGMALGYVAGWTRDLDTSMSASSTPW